jgi:hypothetical protein
VRAAAGAQRFDQLAALVDLHRIQLTYVTTRREAIRSYRRWRRKFVKLTPQWGLSMSYPTFRWS